MKVVISIIVDYLIFSHFLIILFCENLIFFDNMFHWFLTHFVVWHILVLGAFGFWALFVFWLFCEFSNVSFWSYLLWLLFGFWNLLVFHINTLTDSFTYHVVVYCISEPCSVKFQVLPHRQWPHVAKIQSKQLQFQDLQWEALQEHWSSGKSSPNFGASLAQSIW